MLSRTCYIKIFTLRVGSGRVVWFRTPSGIQLHEVDIPTIIVNLRQLYLILLFNRYEQKNKCKKMNSLSQSYNSILNHSKPINVI